eukprot:jgi/Tetstr1/455609/TSEL_042421.t1
MEQEPPQPLAKSIGGGGGPAVKSALKESVVKSIPAASDGLRRPQGAAAVPEPSTGGSSGRSAQTNVGGSGDRAKAAKASASDIAAGKAQPTPAAVARLRQGTGEPRSSSGECTSGESQSEKNAAAFHDGSPKQDSGSQEEDELPAIVATEKATPTEPVPPAKKEHEKAAAVAEEGEQPGEKAKAGGKGDRPKLPRPEGVCKCPRCGGEDTKFCYYNNYNIKQPRYFCKGCQRYWTEGGMLRNVPVGAGRRNKNSLREQEKRKAAAAAAAAADGSPYAMGRNPMMPPPVGMAGAYAHNRHVLWDPEAALDISKMSDMPHGFMQPGMPGMPPPGAMRGRSGMPNMPPQQGMRGMPHPGAGPHSMPPPEACGPTAEDGRPRQRPRRTSPEPPRFPGNHPSPAGYEGKPHMDANMSGYMSPATRMSSDPSNPAKVAAAAAAAAAYAASPHQPYWPGMPWHHHFPWGGSAVAGWAAAAAAAYGHSGPGNWPHGPLAWNHDSPGAPPSGCMQDGSMSPTASPSQGPPHQGQAPPPYPAMMSGYPGAATPWGAWPNSNSGPPSAPSQHPGAAPHMHPHSHPQGQFPMQSSMMPHPYGLDYSNGSLQTGGSGQSSHTMVLGKHSRSYDSGL